MPDRFDTDPEYCERLLAKVLLGDKDAAHGFVDLLAPIIRSVADRFDRGLTKDLIQDVWTHLWSNNCRVLQQWNREAPLVHYVAVVALNVMRDRVRRRTIVTVPMDDNCPDPPDANDPARPLEVKQLAECLESAKGRLSQTHRELIHLRHELGWKHREIAAKLGKTVGYVGTTLTRAERYLREEIMEACAEYLGGFRSIFD